MMFDNLQSAIATSSFDTAFSDTAICEAVNEYLNSPNGLINIEGCDPEHPATKAAILINAEIQSWQDALFADVEGCNIWL